MYHSKAECIFVLVEGLNQREFAFTGPLGGKGQPKRLRAQHAADHITHRSGADVAED